MDNVFIERLWRSLKYECIYPNPVDHGYQVKALIDAWMNHYNRDRPHSTFYGRTPYEVYTSTQKPWLIEAQRTTKAVA